MSRLVDATRLVLLVCMGPHIYIGLAHRLFRLGASARRQAERGVLLRGALLQMR